MRVFGPRTCLGVDAGGSDIKIVELRKAGAKYEVVQAARISPPSDGSAEGLSTALAEFLAQTSTSAARAVCSLPTHLCSVKFADVPRARPADMARVVRFEAESQIPLPLSDVVWGFAERGDQASEMRSVVIAASRKQVVESALASFKAAGVTPAALAVSSLAGAKAVACPDAHGGPALVVDIGSKWMDICSVDDGLVLGTRSARLGGDDLTEALIQDFKVCPDEAERLKRTTGFQGSAWPAAASQRPVNESSEAPSAVHLWAEKAGEEIRKSTVALPAPGNRPQRVILIGGLIGVPGLIEALSRAAGLPVEIGDPWAGMKVTEIASRTTRESPAAFATATGLARMGLDRQDLVNLMPRHLAEERQRRRKETSLLVGMGAVATALLIALVLGAPGARNSERELTRLQSQVAKATAEARRAGLGFRDVAVTVRDAVGEVESRDTNALELLRLLSTHLPRSVWLTELSYESGKSIVLKGGSLSNSGVGDAVDALRLLEILDSITLDYSNLSTSDGAQGYDFQITCALPTAKGALNWTKVSPEKAATKGSNTGIVVQ